MNRDQELALRHLCDKVIERARAGTITFDAARDGLVAVAEGRAFDAPIPQRGEKNHPPKRDLAEERRLDVERWYRSHGFEITVPEPDASNRDFARWEDEEKVLFYRPPTSEVSYEAILIAMGQGGHWTVTDENDRAKIGWKPAKKGYWFLMEAASVCPRSRTCWNDLGKAIRLPCLEEYAIACWMCRELLGVLMDVGIWCFLRTRFGPRVLFANLFFGELGVGKIDANDLSSTFASGGGRAVEVIPNAA